jgi:phage gp16-like protein
MKTQSSERPKQPVENHSLSNQSLSNHKPDHKLRLIKLIHVAKRQLNLDEHTYRLMLTQATAKESLRAMNLIELEQVLSLFKQKGFIIQVKPRTNKRLHLPVMSPDVTPKRRSPASGTSPNALIDKIRAIWITMGHHFIIEDNSETALDAFVRRMTGTKKGQGVDSTQWLSDAQAVKVLESLKNWHRRELIERIKARGQTLPPRDNNRLPSYNAVLEIYLNTATLCKPHDKKIVKEARHD